jgi:hypothetical protein
LTATATPTSVMEFLIGCFPSLGWPRSVPGLAVERGPAAPPAHDNVSRRTGITRATPVRRPRRPAGSPTRRHATVMTTSHVRRPPLSRPLRHIWPLKRTGKVDPRRILTGVVFQISRQAEPSVTLTHLPRDQLRDNDLRLAGTVAHVHDFGEPVVRIRVR